MHIDSTPRVPVWTPLSAPAFVVRAGARHRDTFDNFWIGREVVREMHHQHRLGFAYTLAYAVLPDELIWLFVLGRPWELPEILHRFRTRVDRRLDRRVWSNGMEETLLDVRQDRAAVAREIVAQPVRRGLVRCPGDYPLWDHAWVDARS